MVDSKRGPANDNDGPVFTLTRGELEDFLTKAICMAHDRAVAIPPLVDKQDLARLLACSPKHVDFLRKKGLPWVPVGQLARFEPVKCIEWLRAQRIAGGAA